MYDKKRAEDARYFYILIIALNYVVDIGCQTLTNTRILDILIDKLHAMLTIFLHFLFRIFNTSILLRKLH